VESPDGFATKFWARNVLSLLGNFFSLKIISFQKKEKNLKKEKMTLESWQIFCSVFFFLNDEGTEEFFNYEAVSILQQQKFSLKFQLPLLEIFILIDFTVPFLLRHRFLFSKISDQPLSFNFIELLFFFFIFIRHTVTQSSFPKKKRFGDDNLYNVS